MEEIKEMTFEDYEKVIDSQNNIISMYREQGVRKDQLIEIYKGIIKILKKYIGILEDECDD